MSALSVSALVCIWVLLCFYGGVNGYGYIKYNTGSGIVEGKLNVHFVPHSHDDVGWLKTIDQYYVGSNNSIQGACVENVLDSVMVSLLKDPNRKFIFAEMASDPLSLMPVPSACPILQMITRLLLGSIGSTTSSSCLLQQWQKMKTDCRRILAYINAKMILWCRNGGWCMHDEATSHYIDMIDQTTLGHRTIKNQFNITPRAGWQIDPFGHSAVQAYLLGAELGFDSVHFARIDYQDRAKRKQDKSLEVVWRGSKTFGSSSQIFTNTFPVHYSPPNGFEFEVSDDFMPVQDNPLLYDYNVEQRVNDVINAAITQDGRINVLYSTPSLYTDAKNAENVSWPLKTDDYYPYADNTNAYWTGFFTSRPALKRYIRLLSGYYLRASIFTPQMSLLSLYAYELKHILVLELAARQLEFLAGRRSAGANTYSLGDALGIAQHHDAVTGTAKQHTTNDYEKRLARGASESEAVVSSSLSCLTNSTSKDQCATTLPTLSQVDIPVQQSYLWYGSSSGDTDPQCSGAYIFRPNGSPPTVVSRAVPLKVVRGTLVDEVHQQFDSWIYQVIRLYKDKEHAEVEFTIGPIPTDDSVGKEIITRMTANMVTDKVFYTDSNGRDFLKRVRDYREDWPLQVHQPVAGNYYPLNLGIYTVDKKSEFSVLVDRAVGGASIEDGEVELMLHRRTIFDDSRGVGEALDETVCAENRCEGLTVGEVKVEKEGGEQPHPQPWPKWAPGEHWKSREEEPAMEVLQELDDGSVLLRLAHLYEAGEDAEYSTLAKVELKQVFSGKMIKEVKEVSLSTNQDKSQMKKMTWKVEGDNGGAPRAIRGGPVNISDLVVELGPMEIRTFLLTF
ncbi:hypothetical protein TEA_024216 [Camellia sinensis var. sinensis]|uniref:alpha-mannosidase n=1 Tax=Camellia sinensis var. sinensis TaxID=542762 RepID=A0A4S4DX30_CAMSN|nr:hypothetical protein TEA_024216 [Camellia sinensis var. sinensis]